MYGSKGWCVVPVLVSILFAQIGCDRSTSAQTPGRYFSQKQVSTVTPNGKIRIHTVKEVGEKIEYETEDGKRWRVGYSKRSDGTYEYQTPVAVK